ncbi:MULTISPECIES: dolichyl-phosphate beta-glucosyltransferase [Streptomyces]|uniref:dolichyl-phosphate beta-glucosyltransferase n=3 Tax=Streptomyces TaxID=1883 RepID=A0A5P2BEJ3_STRVZ|nr:MULTISPECIES: dolichyl-phosphate beta-glucosyltransferase [Streptomyces]MYY85003.1 glycosyltransferase [Streptomyces sp. SID335]MYZ11806.1 glycosyltransferase [Streptomyces sp. SID337]NEB47266.1 glycosyltransferase family 2 protein [Streptomyces sp. SID339]QES28420.1 glycosyl transferase [Streptomyces venezuelae]
MSGDLSVDLSVVVPAYNEEQRLGPTLDALRDHLETTHRGAWELIVVDDGSTDRTAEIAAEASAADPRVQLLRGGRNRGKGHALRLGVLATYGRRVLVTDADLAAPIEELDHLDKALTDGHAAAIGSRARPGATIDTHQHRLRELLGRTGNFLIRSVAVPGIRDTQCGFKLFDGDRAREAFAASRLHGWGIDVEILQYFRRAGWPVAEVPVRWSHQEGSKVRPLDYVKVLAELTSLKVRMVRRADVLVALLFLALSVFLYSSRWTAPAHRYIPDSLQDQNQWEWFFAVTADNVRHLNNPLFTTLQNVPDGVNLMANTVMLGLSVPLAPVTWLLGPAVALNVAMTGGLTATAVSWYALIRRRLVPHRGAAAVGAALAAFAPPMVSHANAHPNFIVLFMIPLIIERALRLCEGTRVVRDGVVLGLCTTYQIFLGEEPLLLAALGMLLFALAYAAVRRDVARAAWRPLARGLGIALAVTVPLVAYPLYWQFFGPQSYKSVLHGDNAGNSPLAFLSFAERSLAGSHETADHLAMNPTEQNAFYGWPLAVLAFAIVVRLWERTVVKALAFTVLAAALLSLGPKFRVPLTDIVLPGPWAALSGRPLFESVIESRVAMVCAPALGMLLALALSQLLLAPRRAHRFAGVAAVVLALLPVFPAPLKAVDRVDVPPFIAQGTWRTYLGKGETLVPVPVPDPANAEGLHWQVAAGLGFRIPGGYFNGPWGPDRVGIYGPSPRNTSNLLRDVRSSGRVPEVTPAWREAVRRDLEYWKAGLLVLAPQQNDGQLRATVDALLGRPGKWVDGVWIWDLRKGS